jgi:predicted NBD/HSP70 family sugar kinase
MRGTFGNAGEIGHMPLVPDGEACPCGNCGCLERYVSLEAFRRRRDAIGVEGWIEEAAPVLRAAIAIIENIFDPETIVIGGVDDELPLADLLARAEPLANSIGARLEICVLILSLETHKFRVSGKTCQEILLPN